MSHNSHGLSETWQEGVPATHGNICEKYITRKNAKICLMICTKNVVNRK